MSKNLFIFIFLSFYVHQILSTELDENAENVCTKIEIMDEKNYQLRKQNCYLNSDNFPFSICLSHLDSIRVEKIRYCCDGYHQINTKCEKSCENDCVHGQCVEGQNNTQICDCFLHFGGKNCDQQCPDNTFGLNCENDCKLIINPKLNKNYKHCSCNSATILPECRNICTCRKNSCPQGFIGKNCSVPCKDGKYGYGCLNECKCFADGTIDCNKESGDCLCKPNYYGIHCENSCLTGNLICSNSTLDCRCELTLHQQIEKIKSSKNDFIILLIILALISLIILISLIKYKTKSKKLKKELKIMSVKYLNQTKSNNESSVNLDNLINLNDLALSSKKN